MKASNFAEVGQIRSRSGISMNMRMKDEHLCGGQTDPLQQARHSHEYYTEDDEKVEMEDVGDPQREAEYDAQNT